MANATCKWPNCDGPTAGRGYCARDYARWRRMGQPDRPWEQWVDKATECRWPDCDKRKGLARGLCRRHYGRAQTVGEFESPWVVWDARRKTIKPFLGEPCRWPRCDRDDITGHGLCGKHYQRARDIGDMDEPWAVWRNKCEECGRLFLAKRVRNTRFCSHKCRQRAHYKANQEQALAKSRIRRALAAATAVEKFTDDDVRTTWGDACYLCGGRINYRRKYPHPKSPSLDHVVPLSRGGTHTLDNVAFVHLVCNHSKNNRPAEHLPTPTLFGAT